MKKLFLAAVVMLGFAACTNDVTEDVAVDVPETLTVSFEESSRVQLQNDKTVWSVGDLVSVFYRSDANQQWKFQGKTGDRTGTLKRVSTPQATEKLSKVVVVYPYNENYYINPETCNIQAFMPAEQTYLEDSYGIDGNIMISQSEYNQFSLKNVCGWLKIQLKGDGQVVQKITLKGNNGEQVAGELYIDSADATATLATEMGGAADDAVGGSLVFEDAILTEVTLNCPDGVTLGSKATAFYIALPPQEFSNGFNIKVTYADDTTMTKSTTNKIVIARNTISPMAVIPFESDSAIPNNEIHYTTTDGKVVELYRNGWIDVDTDTYSLTDMDIFGANIISHTYSNGKGIIKCDGDITKIVYAFGECESLISVVLPNTISSLGKYAFCACSNLTYINIPDAVTTIGDGAFSYCSNLKSITIPDNVTWIGDCAFGDCPSLTGFYGKFASSDNRCLVIDGLLRFFAPAGVSEYTIPVGVTKIGELAFSYYDNPLSVTIPDGVISIEANAFKNCSGLTSIIIGNDVVSIGRDAFHECYNLANVTIGNSVISIGEDAFWECTSLASITIPESVTSIGESAFCVCSSLKDVYCKPITPPIAVTDYSYSEWHAFYVNATDRKIYVPAASVDAYKAAEYWSEYAADIVAYDFE